MKIVNGVLREVLEEDIIDGHFTVPYGITEIGDRAFFKLKSLNSIAIPDTVTVIGEYAFADCHSLIEIKIPNSVTKIKNEAFRACVSLESLIIPEGVTQIGMSTFKYCESLKTLTLPSSIEEFDTLTFYELTDLKKVITPWGEINIKQSNSISIIKKYLYLYANHLLKEKYENDEDFFNNFKDIKNLFEIYILTKVPIGKFKSLFYKMRIKYDIGPYLLYYLNPESAKNFDLKIWNQIKDTFPWRGELEIEKAFAEMIEVFGLFHKDKDQRKRIKTFQEIIDGIPYRIADFQYYNLRNKFPHYELDKFCSSFQIVNLLSFKLKNDIEIPKEFEVYLKKELSEEEIKKIKKITGTYGKKLNDFVKENYFENYIERYELIPDSDGANIIKRKAFEIDITGHINNPSLHRIFDGCDGLYDEEFYNFFIDNLPFILKDARLQSDLKNIQRRFKEIKKHYLNQAGIEKITLKQAIDYINNIAFDYHPGNFELMKDVKKAGVTEQKSFDYYQNIYEKNQIRKLYSLVRRSNIYEIDGYTIKTELLRKDDSFSMLVGEKNYTNCCQVFGGIGHNCMAHANSSDDGGIFVTKLLKGGEEIILTQSWDWQNNNLYCHDNFEGTEYLKNAEKSLKQAVMKAIQLDGETIIKKSHEEVEKYIESRRKILKKSISSDKKQELEKLKELEQREIVKVVTSGSGNDDLGIKDFFLSSIDINERMFIDNRIYTLENFQPINYNQSEVYFSPNHSAYSDAKKEQYIIAGSLEDLVLSKEKLEPIYRDERRTILEGKEDIRNYTIKKLSDMEKQVYPTEMLNYKNASQNDFSDSQIYLGEDWYLVYEERENNSIYISDLVRVNPTLEDEKTLQQQEIMNVVFSLLEKYDQVEADLKEDTSYLLYLMNKKLGYIEQIGEDIKYRYQDKDNKQVVSSKEQEENLRKLKKIKDSGNKDLWMHNVVFKKGKLITANQEEKEFEKEDIVVKK